MNYAIAFPNRTGSYTNRSSPL